MPTLRAYRRHILAPLVRLKFQFRAFVAERHSTETSFRTAVKIWRDARRFRMNDVSPDWVVFRDRELDFTTDWFSMRTPAWRWAIQSYVKSGEKLDVLEIGSWEGLSASYILKLLPQADLICVDTWQGSEEHGTDYDLNEVEARFDRNVKKFGKRVTKWKGQSSEFFRFNEKKTFDLIYVDGSHHFIDVLVDAFCSHEILRPGGILIFDDYLWDHYENKRDNPRRAVNVFLKQHKRNYIVIYAGYQVLLRKRGGVGKPLF